MDDILPTRCPKCSTPYGVRRRCYVCSGRPRSGNTRACGQCGKSIYVQRNQAERGEGKFCSVACKVQARTGVAYVTGTRYVRSRDGYVVVKTGIRKWELEHRVVMQKVLGRKLETDEQVHHINGVRSDNDLSNLQILTNAEHQRLHDHFNKHK